MRETCKECHGSGERCYFKGESRFILSRDECPACCGLGFVEIEQAGPNTPDAVGDPSAESEDAE